MGERDPLTRISMPDESSTLPARRNCMKISEEMVAEIARVEEDIRARVIQRRIALKPQFLDFDPCRRGHVTKNQFARALGSLGFELTEDEVNLLAMKYCDFGNKFDTVVPQEHSNRVVEGTGKVDRSHLKVLTTN